MTIASQFARDLVMGEGVGVMEFAESLSIPHRVSQSRPGPYSAEGFPHVPEILGAIADPAVRKVTFCVGTQGAKTMTGTIGVLYLLDQDPGNTLIGLSKTDLARSFSRERFQPMIDENPVLSAHKRADPDEFKTMEMAMDRATFFLASTQSPSDLISRPCRNVWIDEAQLAGPGSIAEAQQRTKTFPHTYKHLLSGTPTTPECDLWLHCLRGTMERLFFPCPHCKREMTFEDRPEGGLNHGGHGEHGGKEGGGATSNIEHRTSNVQSGDSRRESGTESPPVRRRTGLVFEGKDIEGRWIEGEVRKSARYVCPGCYGVIDEAYRRQVVLKVAKFRATNTASSRANRSFVVPSLFTPDVSFGEMAWQFVSATADMFQVSHFVNGYWAMPYAPPAVEVKDEMVDRLRSDAYRLHGPGGIMTTGRLHFKPRAISLCGDPGQNQSHYSIAAHGLNGAFDIIEYGVTLSPEDFLKIARERSWEWVDPQTGVVTKLRVELGLVDSGDFTDRIYRLCMASGGLLLPSKGSGATIGITNVSDIKSHPGLKLYTYVDYIAKRSLYLDTIQGRRPPEIRFPLDASPQFINGHCGQKLVTKRTATGMRKVFADVANDHFGDTTKLHRVITWVLQMVATNEGEGSN